jgi:dTDP-4-dehydrorhamnose 3,5-epimerase
MRFQPTDLPGVTLVEAEPATDERGSFARTYCRQEFLDHGIDFAPLQVSRSLNARRGTLRGLHLQAAPHEEAKLVSCVHGAVFDVAVDLRTGSTTFGRWLGIELTAANNRALHIPAGFAHGFQTLADDTELLYLISELYDPASQVGIRWDDARIGIEWPDTKERVISDRDRNLPYLDEGAFQ